MVSCGCGTQELRNDCRDLTHAKEADLAPASMASTLQDTGHGPSQILRASLRAPSNDLVRAIPRPKPVTDSSYPVSCSPVHE